MSLRYTAEYIPPLTVVDLPLFRLTLGLIPFIFQAPSNAKNKAAFDMCMEMET